MFIAASLLAATVFGVPDACTAGANGTAALVTVHGFRDRTGNLRIAIYRANEDEYLESGQYVQRLDTPMIETGDGDVTVCAPLPEAGRYAVFALHDRNANGKMDPFRDGVGMSRNPKFGLSKPKLAVVETEISGIMPMTIQLNYVQGLSVRPWPEKNNR